MTTFINRPESPFRDPSASEHRRFKGKLTPSHLSATPSPLSSPAPSPSSSSPPIFSTGDLGGEEAEEAKRRGRTEEREGKEWRPRFSPSHLSVTPPRPPGKQKGVDEKEQVAAKRPSDKEPVPVNQPVSTLAPLPPDLSKVLPEKAPRSAYVKDKGDETPGAELSTPPTPFSSPSGTSFSDEKEPEPLVEPETSPPVIDFVPSPSPPAVNPVRLPVRATAFKIPTDGLNPNAEPHGLPLIVWKHAFDDLVLPPGTPLPLSRPGTPSSTSSPTSSLSSVSSLLGGEDLAPFPAEHRGPGQRLAIPPPLDPAKVEARLKSNGWTPAWRYRMYQQSHYHSTTHECLAVYSGRSTLLLGGPANPERVTIRVKVGDVLLLPAGYAHCSLPSSWSVADESAEEKVGKEFDMVGAYPPHRTNWDLRFGTDEKQCREDTETIREWIEEDTREAMKREGWGVGLGTDCADPVEGWFEEGAVAKFWIRNEEPPTVEFVRG